MSHIVTLPGNFTEAAIYPFVRAVVTPEGMPVAGEVIFDFQRLSWIDGTGLTVFCNTLEWLRARSAVFSFINYTGHKQAISYLDDCGFFKEYLGEPLSSKASPRRTSLPFKRIQPSEGFWWLDNTAAPWLADVLRVQVGALVSIKTSAKEIFNNIADHSAEQIGFVHLQHYPRREEIRLTISDFGTGIPATIRRRYGDMSDSKAIRLAVEEGITTRSTPNNRGAGLRILVDYVSHNKGSVAIYSLGGMLLTEPNEDGTPAFFSSQGAGTYPGTLVDIILRTADFVGDPVEEGEDFQWI
ncbi:MAG TPA: hypothetical protein VF782_03755 [Allosphingosinicella sp.]|jgi:anti-sigma regulatory factor (Ser/Thr protein kinase)